MGVMKQIAPTDRGEYALVTNNLDGTYDILWIPKELQAATVRSAGKATCAQSSLNANMFTIEITADNVLLVLVLPEAGRTWDVPHRFIANNWIEAWIDLSRYVLVQQNPGAVPTRPGYKGFPPFMVRTYIPFMREAFPADAKIFDGKDRNLEIFRRFVNANTI